MNKINFGEIIDQIADEKNIDKKIVLETIEAALAAAFRKDYGTPDQNIKVNFDTENGKIKVFDVKEVIKEYPEYIKDEIKIKELKEKGEEIPSELLARQKAEQEKRDALRMEGKEVERKKLREVVLLEDAKKIKKKAKVGDIIKTEITPTGDYGRIAAQTAKQVIIQRIREAERNSVFKEFKGREGEVLNASVQRTEGRNVFVDLGQATGILFPPEQIRGERYNIGQRLKVLVLEVREGNKGPEIVVSRSHPDFVRKLFELEVPEIYAKTVQIKSLAREAGSRTKMAVFTDKDEIDPVGSCVGQRGTRVQAVIAELGGEKIDIVEWNDSYKVFIENALSPAKVTNIKLDEKNKEAKVDVEEDQLSLAIGREGQNVRLAAKLTGWKIDIVKDQKETEKKDDKEVKEEKSEKESEKKEEKKEVEKEEKKDKSKEKPAKEEKAKAKKEETKK